MTENKAGIGGGIASQTVANVVTLEGADPSPIVVDNCPDNCATNGSPIPKCAAGGTCPP